MKQSLRRPAVVGLVSVNWTPSVAELRDPDLLAQWSLLSDGWIRLCYSSSPSGCRPGFPQIIARSLLLLRTDSKDESRLTDRWVERWRKPSRAMMIDERPAANDTVVYQS